jgi:hypothetical protein
MPAGSLPPHRLLAGKRKTHHQAAHHRPAAAASNDVDRRLDELEQLLRQLTAQARDVVQELGEIKAEIKHINGLDDALELTRSRALGADSSMTDVVRALHSNFRVEESSLEAPVATNADNHDRLKAMERVMASAMLRSVADSREPRTGTVDTLASSASEQPGKWPRFGQDTITRFERGIPSRGGTDKLPSIVGMRPGSGEPWTAGSRAQARDRFQPSTRPLVQVAAASAPSSKTAPIATEAAWAGSSVSNGIDTAGVSQTKDTRKGSRRTNGHLIGLTGFPLGWGPRIADPRG